MTRIRIFRTVAALASASLLALSTLGSPAFAANARDVYFGSPSPGTGGDFTASGLVFGTLTNGPVNIGGQTAIPLTIKNEGGQTLNHVKWAAGTAADGKAYNPLFPRPDRDNDGQADPSLPANFSVTQIYPATADCDPASGSSVECEVGSLAAFDETTFIVVLSVPSTPGNYRIWFTGSWNEGWSSTGTNADYQFATGDIAVSAATCASSSNYFLDDESVDLNNGVGCGLSTQIDTDPVGGVGTFANISVGASTRCPAVHTCFGDESTVTVLGGLAVEGGVQWTVRWTPPPKGSIKGVVHFLDGYDAETNPDAFDPIMFNKQGQCTLTKVSNCWVAPLVSTKAFFEATVITPGNGGLRGTLK